MLRCDTIFISTSVGEFKAPSEVPSELRQLPMCLLTAILFTPLFSTLLPINALKLTLPYF